MQNLRLMALLSFFLVSHSHAIDLFSSDAKPQSEANTCQSYAAVLALAAIKDGNFRIETYDQLRSYEQRFRKYAEDTGNPLLHSNWPKAMEKLTNNAYTFSINYPTDSQVEWFSLVKSRTAIKTSIDMFMAEFSGNSIEMVLTSVKRLAGSDYDSGHIVAVLGALGSGLDSNTKVVAFNSAIKTEGASGSMCSPNTLVTDGDIRYQAGIISTNDITLKGFDKNYLLMRLVKK